MAKIGAANILILSVQVPFTRGGAELLIDNLRLELEARDFTVDIVALPFHALPKSSLVKHIALWRALDLRTFAGRKVDLVIATKFPSYAALHPNKVLWLIHQHRQLYELYGTRFGDFETTPEDEALRRMLLEADRTALGECRRRFAISKNVKKRLERYVGLNAEALTPPPPLGQSYRSEAPGNYILSVGRICSIKRVDLIVRALSRIHDQIGLKIVGAADEPAIETYLRSEIDKHHLWHRVEFLGRVDDEALLSLFSRAFAVFYAPFDEDYGFVTLEALASGRPVITAHDSGTVLDYIEDEKNGLIVEPNEKAIAGAFNRLLDDTELYRTLCGNAKPVEGECSWDQIIERLTAPLREPALNEEESQSAEGGEEEDAAQEAVG